MKFVILLVLAAFGCSKTDQGEQKPAKKPYTMIPGPNGLQYHTGLIEEPEDMKLLGKSFVRLTAGCENLPAEFDLRKLGLVSSVKDQGQCGSCGMFAKTGSLESALLGQGIKLDLSEQEMVSCDSKNWGCEGSLTEFSYQTNHGQGLESNFPYTSGRTGRTGSCKSIPVAAKAVSSQYLGAANRAPTEQEVKCALFTAKTAMAITVGATDAWGNPPTNERTPYTNCARSQVNHMIDVVGWWTDSKGKTQFIVKNSWSENWGDKGYMSLPLGCNSLGSEVAYVEVDKKPDPTPTPPTPSPTPPGPSPTPGPCTTPKSRLPAEVQIFNESEVMLGVKEEPGVTYTWTTQDGKVVGSESMIYVSPLKDTVYKLTAKNACAVAESQVRVRIVMSKR